MWQPLLVGERTVVEVLQAIAMTERMSAFLAGYDERDESVERLVNEVILQRLGLAEELRLRLVDVPARG